MTFKSEAENLLRNLRAGANAEIDQDINEALEALTKLHQDEVRKAGKQIAIRELGWCLRNPQSIKERLATLTKQKEGADD